MQEYLVEAAKTQQQNTSDNPQNVQPQPHQATQQQPQHQLQSAQNGAQNNEVMEEPNEEPVEDHRPPAVARSSSQQRES